jgi:uncharacterized protein (UPF0335 family)
MPRKPKPTPSAGHNSVDRDRLRSLVERIESIESERAELASDVKDLLAEAKSSGFDVTAIRAVLRLRRQDKDERSAREELVQSYLEALGDYGTTPLGAAAIARAGAAVMPPV